MGSRGKKVSRKTAVMSGMLIGSFGGGYVATLLGAEAISFVSLFAGTAGGILGIWIAFRMSE